MFFSKKPQKPEEYLDERTIALADLKREIRRLEMKIINANKRIDKQENRLDELETDIFGDDGDDGDGQRSMS